MPEKQLSVKQMIAFEKEWAETMPTRLNVWLSQIPAELKEKLDFSPASILPLQHYLWENFEKSNLFTDEHLEEALCIGYYYGEVHRRNMPLALNWASSDILNEGRISSMLLENIEYKNCYTSIFDNIKVSLSESMRDESYLMRYFNKRIKTTQRTIDEKEYPSVFVTQLDYNYHFYLLHNTNANPLPQIKNLLEEHFKSKEKPPEIFLYPGNDNYLVVEMAKNYHFHLNHHQGSRVPPLISKMAEEQYEGELNKVDIAKCQSATEFYADADRNGDYINEALWLVEFLTNQLPDLVTTIDLDNGVELLP